MFIAKLCYPLLYIVYRISHVVILYSSKFLRLSVFMIFVNYSEIMKVSIIKIPCSTLECRAQYFKNHKMMINHENQQRSQNIWPQKFEAIWYYLNSILKSFYRFLQCLNFALIKCHISSSLVTHCRKALRNYGALFKMECV